MNNVNSLTKTNPRSELYKQSECLRSVNHIDESDNILYVIIFESQWPKTQTAHCSKMCVCCTNESLIIPIY